MEEQVKLDIAGLIEQYLDRSRLDSFFDLLMSANRKVNLVSRETTRSDFDRLAAESLLPLGQLPDDMAGYLDIGSGGGFPSVPILLSGRITGSATLVERTGKKARALGEIATGLGLPATIVASNFEEIRDLPEFDLITLRYVKLSRELLSKALFRLSPGGRFVYYSTPDFSMPDAGSRVYRFESSQDSVIKSFTIFSR